MKINRGQKPIVFACSGGSDTGELADRVARRLAHDGVAEIACLASIALRNKATLDQLAAAPQIFVIDGCPESCARKVLEQAGVHKVRYLGLNELGLSKNSCPVTEEQIAATADAATRLLNL